MKKRNRQGGFDKGRWDIERQRSHIADSRPPSKDEGAKAIGDAIPEVIRSLGLEESIWLNKIEEEWMKLVGDVVAKHARPGRYDAGHLIVFVDSSVWLNELQRYGRTEILSKVQQRFGPEKITGIRLQLDPDGTHQ